MTPLQNTIARNAEYQLKDMEHQVDILQKMAEANKDKIKALSESSEEDFDVRKYEWEQALADWKDMVSIFAKS